MKRGFTMIELIFVIVVLGILASVALPKFAGVQDDAKIASEKGTIGAVRAGVAVVKGKYLIMSTQSNFDGNITTEGGTTGSNFKVACNTNGYPIDLDTVVTDQAPSPSAAATTLFANILSSTPDGWQAESATAGHYKGPASKTTGGVTTSTEINSTVYWEYNGTQSTGTTPAGSGQITMRTTGTF